MSSRSLPSPHAAAAERKTAAWLRSVVDRLQAAPCGTAELDRLLAHAGDGDHDPPDAAERTAGACAMTLRCTTDLNHALILLPRGCNFSIGRRDGVFWAWSQPNDDWEPMPGEVRHDHPEGSGLIVAQTAPLAVTCTALVMRLRRLELAQAVDQASESRT